MSRPTFALITFGCQMNRHDSERIAGSLLAAGYVEAPPEAADVVLFDTCTVREHAAERLRGQVRSLARLKRDRRDVIIGVLGCLAQAEGERLREVLPQADLIVGTHRLPELPSLLEGVRASRRPTVDTGADERFVADMPSRRESRSQGWVAITSGCDNHCAYCIVPAVRGPERSRPREAILGEVERLVADGVIEITLLGQNVNSYGRDLYGSPRFAELLRSVDGLGVPRIRFTTSHPKDLSDDVIAAVAECRGVCEHVHLPAQSGSDRILAAMGRGYTRESYLERVAALRTALPDIAISTDLMVGFPSETAAEFEETVTLVSEVGFSQAFTFIYSPRQGTPAAGLAGRVDAPTARERMTTLVGAVAHSASADSASRLGIIEEVLVEGPAKRGAGRARGRSRRGHTVILEADSALPHHLVTARIVESHTWFLLGEVVADDGGGSQGLPDAASADPRP